MDNQLFFASIGAVVGAVITSLVAPYILQSSARRTARADALKSLLEVEMARWSGVDHKKYRRKQIELKAAVLVSGGSRVIVDNYSKMAAVARAYSDLDVDDYYYNGEGGIPVDIADCTSDAATLLSQSLWVPLVFRFIPRLRLRSLIKRQGELEKKYTEKRGESCWKVKTI